MFLVNVSRNVGQPEGSCVTQISYRTFNCQQNGLWLRNIPHFRDSSRLQWDWNLGSFWTNTCINLAAKKSTNIFTRVLSIMFLSCPRPIRKVQLPFMSSKLMEGAFIMIREEMMTGSWYQLSLALFLCLRSDKLHLKLSTGWMLRKETNQ